MSYQYGALDFRMAWRVASATTGVRLHVLGGPAVRCLWRGGLDPDRAAHVQPASELMAVGFRSTAGELHLCVSRDACPPDSYRRVLLPAVVLKLSVALATIAAGCAPDEAAQVAALYNGCGSAVVVQQLPRVGILPDALPARAQRQARP